MMHDISPFLVFETDFGKKKAIKNVEKVGKGEKIFLNFFLS